MLTLRLREALSVPAHSMTLVACRTTRGGNSFLRTCTARHGVRRLNCSYSVVGFSAPQRRCLCSMCGGISNPGSVTGGLCTLFRRGLVRQHRGSFAGLVRSTLRLAPGFCRSLSRVNSLRARCSMFISNDSRV